jgi:hypothetical protein
VKLPVVVGVTASVPLVGSTPVQAPLAEQLAALVLDHMRLAPVPNVTLVGETDKVAVGAAGGGGGGGAVIAMATLNPVEALEETS